MCVSAPKRIMLDMAIRAPRDLCDCTRLCRAERAACSHCWAAAAAAAIAMGIKAIKHSGSTEFKFTIYKQMFLCSHEGAHLRAALRTACVSLLCAQCNSGDPTYQTCNQRSSHSAYMHKSNAWNRGVRILSLFALNKWIVCAAAQSGQISCAHSNWTSIRNAIETQ